MTLSFSGEGQVANRGSGRERVVQNGTGAAALGHCFQLALNLKSGANVRFVHVDHLVKIYAELPAERILLCACFFAT